jgi:hypothetical protein
MFIPNWFTIGVFAIAGAAPWMQLRYSLRTLLIAAAVVSVGIGLVVVMLRGS